MNCSAATSGVSLSRSGWGATSNAPSSASDAPWHAIDGNPATRFSTGQDQVAGLHLQLDLQAPQSFDELAMTVPGSPTDYARSYAVEVSNDGQSWSAVANCLGNGATEVVSFPVRTARFVRVVLTAAASDWWSVDELNLYGTSDCTASVTGSALPRTGWVAGTNAHPSASDVPARALDGNLATRFSTDADQSPGLYFQVDLGAPASFDEVATAVPGSPDDYARSFEVQVSPDSSSWTTVASCQGAGSSQVVSFPRQTAKYFRIVLTGSATSWWSIDELNLYGTYVAPPTTTTTARTRPRANLYSSASPVTVGDTVTYTAQIVPKPAGGSISFLSGGRSLPGCTGMAINSSGEASCAATYYSAGSRNVEAVYSGYGSFLPAGSAALAESVQWPAAGYWLATANGNVYGLGGAPSLGSPGTSPTTGPVRGIAGTPDGHGYWVVTANGTVSAFGGAHYYGDLPALGKHVTDVVAIAPTSDGRGYYLVGADGGFFTFGDATFHGSLPGQHIRVRDIVGMVATPGGGGYLLVGADGGVFTFGEARFYGSLPGIHRHVHDIKAILPSSSGTGYVLVGADGGAFVFGTGVRFHGSLPAEGVKVTNIVGIALTPDNGGYYMAGTDGRVYGFGDAQVDAEPAGLPGNLPVAAIAGT